jgi:hypothetical protein
MDGGELTTREAEIIHQLLAERGITEYEILFVIPEGQDLPGCTYDNEIELLSGVVVTPTNAYDFWLDWIDGRYTFSVWREIDIANTKDRDEILTTQQRLRQKEASQ